MLSEQVKEIITGLNNIQLILILTALGLASLFQFFGLINLLLSFGLDKISFAIKANWYIAVLK